MPDDPVKSTRLVLDPNERIAEVLFGLIMVLTFTGSLSVAGADRAEVRTMLIGALGCNLAWGVIDAVLYLMGSLSEKGTGLLAFRAVRRATDPNHAHRVIAERIAVGDRVRHDAGRTGNAAPAVETTAGTVQGVRACTRTIGWVRWASFYWCSFPRFRWRSRSLSCATPGRPCGSPMPSLSRCCSSWAMRLDVLRGITRG